MTPEDYCAQGYWETDDLWSSFEACALANEQRIAFIEGDSSITFGALRQTARSVGLQLCEEGVRAGDVVIIHSRNSVAAVQAMLACAWIGAVMTPLPPMFSVSQLSAVCRGSSARVLIALGDAKEVARATEAAEDAGVTLLEWGWIHRAAAVLESEDSARVRLPVSADALALLVYSSGTTGAPKGVMHSANTVRYAVRERARLHGVVAEDTGLVVSQFGFVGSIVFGLLLGPLTGSSAVLMRTWDPDEALRLIARHRVTYGLMMPTHVHDVLNSPRLEDTDVSSLRRCAMGGLSRERRLEVRRRLCPQPLPAYGMSECLGFTSCAIDDPSETEKALATDGRPYPGTHTRIMDPDGLDCDFGVAGAILVTGPSRFLGYYAAPDLTRAAISDDGWFRTGDVGWLDADGYIGFVARQNDIIRRGGVTIVPGDIESALMDHPRVAHVAVVGLPDDRLGERACACVITRDGGPVTLPELAAFLEVRRVARYTWPERVELFQEFPRSASLKVQKRVLVEQIARRDADPLKYPFAALPATEHMVEVAAGVHWIRMPIPYALDHINLWAIEDVHGWTVVDTGVWTEQTTASWEALLARWPDSRPVTRVLCTHMHPDHVGNAGWFVRRFSWAGCRLWMTRAEYLNCRVVVADTGRAPPDEAIAFYRRAGWSESALDGYRARFGRYGQQVHPLPESYRRLQDGEALRIGSDDWRVVTTSGHSPEHAMLHCAAKRLLIAGDQVLPRISSNVSVHPMEPDANPMGDWIASLQRLRSMLPDDVLVLPSHNEPFHGLHARLDALMAMQLRATEHLRSRLHEPCRVVDTFEALFGRPIGEDAGPRHAMATGEAVANLNYLVDRGEVHVDDDAMGVRWYRLAAS